MKLPKHWTTKKHAYMILIALLLLAVFSTLTIFIARKCASSEAAATDDVILQIPDDYAENIIAADKITFNDSKSDGFLYSLIDLDKIFTAGKNPIVVSFFCFFISNSLF